LRNCRRRADERKRIVRRFVGFSANRCSMRAGTVLAEGEGMSDLLTASFAALIVSFASGCVAGSGDVDDGLESDDASSIDGGGSGGDSSPFTPPPGACEGPLGKPMNPSSLKACCPDHPGNAHCVSAAKVPTELQGVAGKCEGSSDLCVPDDFIETGGVFTPKTCTAFGGPGRCVSLCVPQVEEKAGILLQDVCGDDEKCVPCINPLDKKPTGVCEIEGHCKGEDAGAKDSSPAVDTGPAPCPHVGPPVIEPTKLPACQCPDSHCVSKTLVPAALASQIAGCSSDAGGLCVPDVLIASGGDFIPKTCSSVAGNEGRCLSTCLPAVAAQAASLPQDTCGATEKCVPCYDPISLKDTGACKLSCDPGPIGPPKPLPKCCSLRGSCVPTASIPPDSASALQQDKCTDKADLCVPDVFLHKTWTRIDCDAKTLLGSAGPGVCMPDCIKGMSFLLLKGACPDGMKCAPCKDPLTGKATGACELKL
jgi:hypothetical protein